MFEPRRILVGVDFRSPADRAIRQADALARLWEARFVACDVIPGPTGVHALSPLARAQSKRALSRLRPRLAHRLGQRLGELTRRGPDEVQLLVAGGDPGTGLVEIAGDRKVDLLVIGEPLSRSRMGPLATGVAAKVMRNAHCPVLIARADPSIVVRTILAATDLSDPSLPAIRAAAAVARIHGASLTVVHIMEGVTSASLPVMVDATMAEVAGHRLAEALSRSDVAGDVRVTLGPATAAIGRLARRLGAELVVVGTRGQSALRRLALGSTAEMVAESAPCSVLAVPLGDAAPALAERP
jgi:nucleotide-binding universal stress UspA family protein